MGTNIVHLTDDELLVLDGHCSDSVQAAVNDARRRVEARGTYPGLPPAQAGFVADVVAEAEATGRLRFSNCRIDRCRLCGRDAGYVKYKSGPRKGQDNYGKPRRMAGVELAARLVTVRGHVRLGGCLDCVGTLLPILIEALRDVAAEVPDKLRADGSPIRARYQDRRCRACGWAGHEGQMASAPTLLGEGTYPAACPACGASGGGLFEFDPPVERLDTFTVVEGKAR